MHFKDTQDDDALRRRIEALALDDVVRDESATITPRTLARGSRARADATLRDPRMTDDVDLGSLPKISTKDLVEVGTLGEGGMGRVVLARQSSLARDVAVKTLHDDAAAVDLAALVREARVAGSLEHPSIIPVHALGVNERGAPLLVMKRIEGVSWRKLLDDPAHPAWKTHVGGEGDRLGANLDILVSVCRALELAHARGVVHRDVKPENVMIGAYGEVYLVDWGIATIPGPSPDDDLVIGTPGYLAPEMVLGEIIDERTDVYLLGATLHRVLTGKTRHTGKRIEERLLAAAASSPATYAATIPAALGELCNEACAKDSAKRPPKVAVFRERLLAFKRHRSAIAICATADARLESLVGLLASSPGAVPPDLVRAYRLAAEARFGFAQSLAQYPEYEDARRGERRSIEALVDLELRQGHVDTAAALLEEAVPAAPELVRRVEEARAKAAERAREEGRLRELDRAHDQTVGYRGRIGVILGFLGVNAILWTYERVTRGLNAIPTPRSLPLYMLVVIGVTAAGGIFMRRTLMASAVNRRIAAILFWCQLAMMANRVLGAILDRPAAHTVAIDLLLMGVGAGILGAFIPRALASVPFALGAYLVLELRPDLAALAFLPGMTLTLVALMWAMITGRSNPSESR